MRLGKHIQLERREHYDQSERQRKQKEQPKRGDANHANAGKIESGAGDDDKKTGVDSVMTFTEPRGHLLQVENKKRRVDRHVENAGYQREPGFLKAPEISQTPPHPGVVPALLRQGARKFADHERGRQAPKQRKKEQNQDPAAVA